MALRQATESGIGGADETRRKKRKTDDVFDGHIKHKRRYATDVLQPGATIAFRQPRSKTTEGEWIQCNIIRVSGEGTKAKYEVQDPEPDENGSPGQTYRTTTASMVYVPNDNFGLVPYAKGAHVLARYPETTTFYRAEVIDSKVVT